jgi:hypothetical protein
MVQTIDRPAAPDTVVAAIAVAEAADLPGQASLSEA